MAALPAVSHVVRVDFHFTQTGIANLQIRNFFHYQTALTTADAVTWLTAIRSAWMSNVMPHLSNTLSLVLTELTDLSSDVSPQVQDSTGGAGSLTGVINAAQVAVIIKHKIVRRYRGGHPRVYVPGTLQGWLQDPRTWQSTPLGTLVGGYAAYIAAAVTTPGGTGIGTITHCNVSYFQGFENVTSPSGRCRPVATPRATPIVDTIVNISGNPIVGSQRRRTEQP